VSEIDLEPHQEAADAVLDLSGYVEDAVHGIAAAERTTRNAVMQEAVETTDQDPYQFWLDSEEHNLITRIAGALGTIARLVERL